MKRRAIVIFSDGSKKMAHNTDDLMFRWHERKIVEADDVHEVINGGFYIPDFTDDAENRELVSIRALLGMQQKHVEQQIILAKVNSCITNNELAAIKLSVMTIQHQIQRINDIMKTLGVSVKSGEKIDDLREKHLDKLYKEKRYLINLLKDKFDYVVDYDAMNRELER